MTPASRSRLATRPSLAAYPLIGLLRAYRALISPLYGQVCRYYPSCSAYALEAVRTYGAARGSWMAMRRLGRCHPWSTGGVDPVPARRTRSARQPAQRLAHQPSEPEAGADILTEVT